MINRRYGISAALAACAMSIPAWAYGHGGGAGHGATVSAAAHAAHMSGQPAGSSVRAVARSGSQGPTHASANAISHVQNSPGKANSNSVLGNGAASTAATHGHATAHGHSMAKTKPQKSGKGKSSRH